MRFVERSIALRCSRAVGECDRRKRRPLRQLPRLRQRDLAASNAMQGMDQGRFLRSVGRADSSSTPCTKQTKSVDGWDSEFLFFDHLVFGTSERPAPRQSLPRRRPIHERQKPKGMEE